MLREVNDRIEQLNASCESEGTDGIVCECGQPDCMEKIAISSDAYERVGRFPTYFLVKRGHAPEGSERVVERADDYLVVEKAGQAAQAAIRHDPRRRQTTRKETR